MEHRRTHRYKLQLPLHIIQLGDAAVNRLVRTRDISSGGVCFVSPTPVMVGGKVEYLITLSNNNPKVRIRCLGKVLRSNHAEAGGTYEVAVTMERYQFVRCDQALPCAALASA